MARKYTKRGELMATFVLEDLVSSIEVWVFPRTMTEVGHLLADDTVVCVKGRLDLREEPAKLVCMEIKRPELNPSDQPLHVDLPIHALTDERVESLKRLLSEHPGPRRCCSTSAPSASSWPPSGASTPPAACWPSCGSCSGPPAWRFAEAWSGPR